MPRRPPRPVLTAEQSADADRLHATLLTAADDDLRLIAETLAATTDETIFGANEFVLRDVVLGIAATAVEAALADREKKCRRQQHRLPHLPRGRQAPAAAGSHRRHPLRCHPPDAGVLLPLPDVVAPATVPATPPSA